jgi:hypothetical protein
MPKCDVFGNDYDKAFQIVQSAGRETFDSFECAIHAFGPERSHCHCKIIGHGVEKEDEVYCCAHCADHEDRS